MVLNNLHLDDPVFVNLPNFGVGKNLNKFPKNLMIEYMGSCIDNKRAILLPAYTVPPKNPDHVLLFSMQR